MSEKKKVGDFLTRLGMHPGQIEIGVCAAAFADEMERGLRGEASSLLMIPTYLSAEGRPENGETALAVDIGGTNLRVALLSAEDGRMKLEYSDVSPVPGSRFKVTKDEFFQAIADKLAPVVGRSANIGVAFSHPAEILPNRDGRLITFSKEIEVEGSDNMEICRELMKKLAENGCKEPKNCVLLNDTVAVLLSGLNAASSGTASGNIGLVLGTGMNMCYTEKTSEIKKLTSAYANGTMIVNTEAGNFNKLPFAASDRALDAQTANPGDHRLEKATSGRYLGDLILLVLRDAAREGLLSDGAFRALQALPALGAPDTSAFLSGAGDGALSAVCVMESDRAVTAAVIDAVYERDARLIAAMLAGAIMKMDAGHAKDRPVCVSAEGSMFFKLYSYKEKMGALVRHELAEKLGLYCELVSSENATLAGTALAAMLN